MQLKSALMASPGPKTPKEALVLYFKGVAMGAADIIPGVSGGTIALISGIYTHLIDAIKSVDLDTFKNLGRLRLADALAGVHLRFLVVLLAGIGTAIIGIARLMHWLLKEEPVLTWSAFFGLILASILILALKVQWSLARVGGLLGGAVFGFLVVGMIPVQTPTDWWFIILVGMIAICAMILPGISGAFLMLILGKYEYVTGALKNPTSIDSLVIIVLFAVGAALGIGAFSRVLSYLLHHFEAMTLAFLTGLMAGSLRKVWPWKEVLETKMIRGKEHVLREANILPNLDAQLAAAVALMVAGLVLIWLLERWSRPGDGG
ncbi:MAG: DUF368 domain-containing protein [bacterium]|nr:DUF368 domain-containing protein [bacterium]